MGGPFDEFIEILERSENLAGIQAVTASSLASESCQVAAISGVREHFVNSHDPDGTPWADLKNGRPNGGGSVLRDTDRMMAATTSSSEGNVISVENNRVQAALHQYGGTIVPVNVQFLTIPNTVEAKRAGSARLFPGQLFPRINRSRTAGVLVDKDDVVQYWLSKKSVIPARPFLGFSEDTIDVILDLVSDDVVKWILNGNGAP